LPIFKAEKVRVGTPKFQISKVQEEQKLPEPEQRG